MSEVKLMVSVDSLARIEELLEIALSVIEDQGGQATAAALRTAAQKAQAEMRGLDNGNYGRPVYSDEEMEAMYGR